MCSSGSLEVSVSHDRQLACDLPLTSGSMKLIHLQCHSQGINLQSCLQGSGCLSPYLSLLELSLLPLYFCLVILQASSSLGLLLSLFITLWLRQVEFRPLTCNSQITRMVQFQIMVFQMAPTTSFQVMGKDETELSTAASQHQRFPR